VGRGELAVAASLVFVPAVAPVSPVYRGLYVQRIVQRKDEVTGAVVGGPLQTVERGAVVQITIQVCSVAPGVGTAVDCPWSAVCAAACALPWAFCACFAALRCAVQCNRKGTMPRASRRVGPPSHRTT
jgi:hypothetical protein